MDEKDLSLFEADRSSWDLQVTGAEIGRVYKAFNGMHPENDPVVWVQKVGPATRRWWSNSFKLNAFIDTAGTETDPEKPVAIPLIFLGNVGALATAYGTATIFLNQAENVLTAKSSGEYVFVDETFDVDTPAPFDPVLPTLGEKVTVRAEVFDRIANQYRSVLFSLDEIKGPPAFLALNSTREFIRWTTDWSRFGRPRASGYAAASTWVDHFDIVFYPVTLFNFMSFLMYEDELTLGVDQAMGSTVFCVSGLDWAAWCPVEDENWERWQFPVETAFEQCGFELVEPEDDDDLTAIIAYGDEHHLFRNDDLLVAVEIIEGMTGPDCVRLRHTTTHDCLVTEMLLKEVTSLNEALVGARLVIDDACTTLIVDVDNPSNPEEIAKGLRCLMAGIGRVAGLDELLPLFGGIAPLPEWLEHTRLEGEFDPNNPPETLND